MRTPAITPMSRLAAAALALANLVMLFVAAFQKWGYEILLSTIWWETVIIGFYNAGRIFVVCMFGEPLGKWISFANAGSRLFVALGLIGFFVLKFGGFALALGLLVLLAPAALTTGGDTHNLVAAADAAQAVGPIVFPVVVALFLSHGVSFVQNYIRRREYERSGVLLLLFWPYARLAGLLLIVLLGLAATRTVPGLAQTPLFTVGVILLKLVVDVATHRLEHRSRGAKD